MRIVIIEDEKLAAEDLQETIAQAEPGAIVEKVLRSVKEAKEYFAHHVVPDLIFSDIQLGDGLSFEIFAAIPSKAPVIFCTAFDEYALQAFKANGIDYVLKPFSYEVIEAALQKLRGLRGQPAANMGDQFATMLKMFGNREVQRPASILVHMADKIIPVQLESIALFYLKNELTHIYTLTGKTYPCNKSLDELEKITGTAFFRVNRQYLVGYKAVSGAANHLSRKISIQLCVPFAESIVVSKEKVSAFLKWLAGF